MKSNMTQTDKATFRELIAQTQRIEDKLDTNLQRMNDRIDKQDEEIAKVREGQANARGVNTALGAVAGAVISIVGAFIQRGGH